MLFYFELISYNSYYNICHFYSRFYATLCKLEKLNVAKWEQDDKASPANKLSEPDVENNRFEIKNSSDHTTEGILSSSQYELTDELKLSFDQWCNASKFGCRACHKTFPTPSCLGSHIRQEHRNQTFQYALYDCQSKVAKQHACKLCSITLIQNKAILATHLMRRHNIFPTNSTSISALICPTPSVSPCQILLWILFTT